jgi:hypothetical protein
MFMAIVVMALGFGVLTPASAFAVSGGGCSGHASGGGFTIQACISAHGGRVYPDYYVDAVPGVKNTCSVVWSANQVNGPSIPSGQNSCSTGHVTVGSWPTNGYQWQMCVGGYNQFLQQVFVCSPVIYP